MTTNTDALISSRAWSKEQRQRIIELEVALNLTTLVLLDAYRLTHKRAHGEDDDGVELCNNIRHVLVTQSLPELGKSNAAEFGAGAMPSTTEQEIYDALGMGSKD